MATSSPESIFNSSRCIAKTLTTSENHATILFTSKCEDEDASPPKSLLKLTVQPFHLDALGPQESIQNRDSNDSDEEECSSRILSFLKEYEFRLDSESGAEYSYFSVSPKNMGILPTIQRLMVALLGGSSRSTGADAQTCFKAELISPASERQIQRAMPSPALCLINETPELYNSVTLPHIQSIVESGSLSWIENVVNGTKEKERLLLDTEQYILNIDTKWRSHPDPNTTPRSEWHSHSSVKDLYCLAIFKETSVTSLRDLRGKDHLPVLVAIMKECPLAIQDIYGVPPDQLRIFVHYQPQFYAFHIHFTRLENEIGCQVERGHLVSDIIQNLEIDPDYYKKRTITYKLKVTDKLYQLMSEAMSSS